MTTQTRKRLCQLGIVVGGFLFGIGVAKLIQGDLLIGFANSISGSSLLGYFVYQLRQLKIK